MNRPVGARTAMSARLSPKERADKAVRAPDSWAVNSSKRNRELSMNLRVGRDSRRALESLPTEKSCLDGVSPQRVWLRCAAREVPGFTASYRVAGERERCTIEPPTRGGQFA